MEHQSPDSSGARSSTAERLVYWMTVVTIAVWTGLGTFALVHGGILSSLAGSAVVSAITSVLLIALTGVASIEHVLRRWLVA